MEIEITTKKYIVARSEDSNVLHFILATANSKFLTGQPIVEQFDTIEDATSYIDAIKGEGYAKENYKYLFETPTAE